ncbi:MAG TPA: DNA-3-methyladenine glycosylase I [Chloroflexota bacterium]
MTSTVEDTEGIESRERCSWAGTDPLMLDYHDREWGVPIHDDPHLFELLILEGAQAGLSWSTILRKREGYRAAFAEFDPAAVAGFGPDDVERLVASPSIVRNRRKIESAITNARALLAVVEECGSFDRYIWGFVDGTPIQDTWKSLSELPASTDESAEMSRDLLRRGFKFVGPTICYAFMQSAGLVNDHVVSCFRHSELGGSSAP